MDIGDQINVVKKKTTILCFLIPASRNYLAELHSNLFFVVKFSRQQALVENRKFSNKIKFFCKYIHTVETCYSLSSERLVDIKITKFYVEKVCSI
jgi:hypothetical protein